jgi:hypothetical protein
MTFYLEKDLIQQFLNFFFSLDNIRDHCLELTLGRQIVLILNTVNGSVVFLHLSPRVFHFLIGQVIILLLECVHLICLSSLVTTFLCMGRRLSSVVYLLARKVSITTFTWKKYLNGCYSSFKFTWNSRDSSLKEPGIATLNFVFILLYKVPGLAVILFIKCP